MNKRTSFITAGAVTGVLLAGTAAVGANIGILNAADNGGVGELSAATVVMTVPETVPTSVEPQVIDIYLDEPATTTATTAPPTTVAEPVGQEFAVVDAGSVRVKATATGVLLDGVDVAAGWTWTSSQSAGEELVVRFTSDSGEYVFYADLADDGSITARVDETIVNIVQAPSAPASRPTATAAPSAPATTAPRASGYDDDDHDDHHDDDDHDDDHDEDHEEHEGGGDDD